MVLLSKGVLQVFLGLLVDFDLLAQLPVLLLPRIGSVVQLEGGY